MAADVNKTISLNYTATTQKLQAALKKIPDMTDEEFKKASKAIEKAMKKAEKSTQKAAKKSSKSWKEFGEDMGKVGVAIGAVGVGVVAVGQHFADLTHELVDAAAKSGIAVETLAGLRLAAEGSGRSFTDLEGGLIKFQTSMSAAMKPTGKQAELFKKLGVSVKDDVTGGLRDSNTVFNEVVGKLSEMESGIEKNTITMDLFGKSAGPAFIQSGAIDAMGEFNALANEFGVNTGPQAVATAAQFQRSIANLKLVAEGSFQKILNSLAGGGDSGDGINKLMDGATKAMIYFGSIAGDVLAFVSVGFENLIGVGFIAQKMLSGDMAGALDIVNSGAREAEDVMDNLSLAFVRADNAVDDFDQKVAATQTTSDKAIPAAEENMEGYVAATKAATKATSELDAAVKVLQAAQDKIASKTMNEREKVIHSYDLEIEKLEAIKGKGLEKEEIDQAIFEMEKLRKEELMAIDIANVEKLSQLKKEADEAEAERRKMAMDQNMAFANTFVSSAQSMSSSITSIAAASGDVTALQAERLHRLNQTTSVAGIAMKAAEGIMAATATYIGRPAMMGAAIGLISLTAGLQTAAVLAQPPPTFDTGGMIGNTDPARPDEKMVRAVTGEAILDRATVSRIGGAEGVRALQAGAMAPHVVVISPWKHLGRYNRSAAKLTPKTRKRRY